MSTFAALKLTAAQKPTNVSAVQNRRNKLAERLVEQMALATATQAGSQFTATRLRTVKDEQTGERTTVEVNKRVKQWWFTAENGKLALSVRYGARQLELAKGKIQLTIMKMAAFTLGLIMIAVVVVMMVGLFVPTSACLAKSAL